MSIKRAIIGPVTGVLLLGLVSACGAPQQGVTIRNVSDATAGAPSTQAATARATAAATRAATSVVTSAATQMATARAGTQAATTAPTSHDMGAPTTRPVATAATQQGAQSATQSATQQAAGPTSTGDFIVGWILYGTPTPQGAGGAAATQPAATRAAATQPANQPAVTGAATNDFIVGWILYGTPTQVVPRPTLNAPLVTNTPIQTTPAPATAAPTQAPQQPAQQATATVPTIPVTATTIPSTPVAAISTATQPAGTTSASGNPARVIAGNPSRGQQIFNGIGTCASCHDVKNNITIVGPSLKGVASRAGTRKPGLSARDYLYESITKTNTFIVPNFQAGLMPQNFQQLLSAQQIEDVIAYLMTLK